MARLKGPSASLVRATVRGMGRDLTGLPNVAYVSVGEKIVKGERSGRRAIKIHVRDKGSAPARDYIPRSIEIRNRLGRKVGEVETDVVELKAAPRLFGIRSGHSLIAFDNDLGVAGLPFSKGQQRYVMTNAHVACDIARNGATGPVAWRHAGATVPLGPVVYASVINAENVTREDAAVVRIDSDVETDDFFLDLVNVQADRLDDLRQNGREHWFVAHGRLYRCANPEPVDVPIGVVVDDVEIPYGNFWQFDAVEGDPQPGVSGALLMRTVESHHVACGLVFAGIPGQFVWAFSFRTMFERIFAGL